MANDAQKKWILEKMPKMLGYLREDKIPPESFCATVFFLMVAAAAEGNEDIWGPILESFSQDVLKLLSSYAKSEYESTSYVIEPSFLGNFSGSIEAYQQRTSELSSILRRLLEEIERRGQRDAA
jgi:hypothetical protein